MKFALVIKCNHIENFCVLVTVSTRLFLVVESIKTADCEKNCLF